MSYKYILALDPSGNFHEGKGTTGWCLFNCISNRVEKAGSITARGHECMQAYWEHVLDKTMELIEKHKAGETIVVIEDYLLYKTKANAQINSRMETPKLIGILQYILYCNDIKYAMQTASDVKVRWSNNILHSKNYIQEYKGSYSVPKTKVPIDRHALDSIRHAVHYHTFYNK